MNRFDIFMTSKGESRQVHDPQQTLVLSKRVQSDLIRLENESLVPPYGT
jgi:hypothetical protein